MEDYSRLEVVPGEHQHAYPQVIPSQWQDGPEAVVADDPGTVVKEGGSYRYHNIPASEDIPPQPRAKRRCGLPIRIFWTIVAIAALVVVGGIAGGIAGGLITKAKVTGGDQPDGNSTAAPTNVNVLAGSMISAANFTDGNNATHRYVFFQDTFGAIIARRWESENGTWATDNVTDILSSSGNPATPLQPSTPLASTAKPYTTTSMNLIDLFYISADNQLIADIVVDPTSPTPSTTWAPGLLPTYRLLTGTGSRLAVAWSRCPADDCDGWWQATYQDASGVWVSNGSDPVNPRNVIAVGSAATNTSLALFPRVDGSGVTGLTLMAESLPESTVGAATQYGYAESEWSYDGELLANAQLPPPDAQLQFAISVTDGFLAPVYMALLPDGNVTVEYGGSKGGSAAEFRGGPAVNFTAIAASEEAVLYGISNDTIVQYSIQTPDTGPLYFEYMETIYP